MPAAPGSQQCMSTWYRTPMLISLALRLDGFLLQRHESIQPHAKNRPTSFPFRRDRALGSPLKHYTAHTSINATMCFVAHLQCRRATSSDETPRRPRCNRTLLGLAWRRDCTANGQAKSP